MSSVATNELDVEWELYMSKSGTSNVREIFKEIRGYNSELDDLLNSAINCNVISTKLFVDILSFPELYEVINNSDVDVALFADCRGRRELYTVKEYFTLTADEMRALVK